MLRDKYILDGHTPIPTDLETWARWFDSDEKRRVGYDDFDGGYVSTVFLGLDHNFGRTGPPLLFETMIFGGPNDGYQERYATWDEAVEGHARILTMAPALAVDAVGEAHEEPVADHAR